VADRDERGDAGRRGRRPDLVVVSALKAWTCSQCGNDDGGWLIMDDGGPVCMTCADMDHLVFLPSGDAALTRRAGAASGLSAVVVRFSRARKRYERQGVLVEEEALTKAEQQCLEDREARARRRERDAERRAAGDVELQARMAAETSGCFRVVRPSGLSRSPGTQPSAAAGGSAGAPRDGPSTQVRSNSRSWLQCDMRTRRTTSC
jgi:hypothetical protein